jgi:hypothetical protein
MRILLCISLSIWATLITLGVVVAQSTTTFDGSYAGVSNTASGGRSCVAGLAPRPLTIGQGTAVWYSGLTGDVTFRGTVTPQSDLLMKGSDGAVVTAKINPSGRITRSQVYAVAGTGGCSIISVWQRRR